MNIIIIGFMGVGKSVVGELLSKKLNMNFIDMDYEIEKRQGMTISEIFNSKGQEYFRKLENELLDELSKKDNYIISTGGGIVTREENCKILRKQKVVVFLDANVKTIIRNVSNEIEKRPLLKGSSDLEGQIMNLLNERYEHYKECSNINIDVNNKNIDEVVSQILVYIR